MGYILSNLDTIPEVMLQTPQSGSRGRTKQVKEEVVSRLNCEFSSFKNIKKNFDMFRYHKR